MLGMMHVTLPLSRFYDADQVVEPEHRGQVAWSLFNEHYQRLQNEPWSKINRGTSHPWHVRLRRLWMAWYVQRTGALLDLERKARILARFPLPRDPDVVFFGAEVGWEALLVQALFGAGGRCVLVDVDARAYQRHVEAPRTLRVKAPPGRPRPRGWLELVREPSRLEYVRADFFDWAEPDAFDVGIDWGLLEHFPGEGKRRVMDRFHASLRPGAYQISAVPRDSWATRMFYATFPDELNFGYRELLGAHEHEETLRSGGFEVVALHASPTTVVALARRPP